jgi:hypothetical protein
LIEQVQDDRDALVVHAEIHLEILDQPCPRQIGLLKCLFAGYRYQPLRFDPSS